MNKSQPSFNDLKKQEELEKGAAKQLPPTVSQDYGSGREISNLHADSPKKVVKLSPAQTATINSKSPRKPGRQHTDGKAQAASIEEARKRKDEYRKQGVLKTEVALGKSFNDIKKSEEELAKTGTMTKLALAAALAGPILSHEKGSLFEDSKAPVTRSIAGQPAHEKDHDEEHTELGDGVTHVTSKKSYSVTHKVEDKPTAASMKEKFKSIRNMIKGDENGAM